MGAQDPAQRVTCRFLQGFAITWFGPEGSSLERPAANHWSVSFLLDTNVVSEWTKPKPNAGVVEWLTRVDEGEVFLSVVTFAEVRHGIERLAAGARRRRLDEWLRSELP